MLINGELVNASHNAFFERCNPLSQEIATRAPAATAADATAAVDAASQAFPAWSAMGAGARRALLTKAAHELEARADAFAYAMAHETGASRVWASFNVHLGAGMLLEAAAGLPPGVVSFVTNAPADAGAVVEAMISHPAVRRVNFTGSTRVGRIIAETCARHLKPAVLELGGKAPLLVLDDADLDAAVATVAFGAFANFGKICMSTERIVVDSSIADEFVAKLKTKAMSLPIGDPRDTAGGPKVLGSVVDRATVDRCNAMVDDALAKGATLVCGGKSHSLIMPATVLDHVTPDMQIYSEESFGPVKPVVRVDGVDAAVACANDNAYGLSAAVFGRDIARAWGLAQRIQSGICHINGPTVHDEAQMPFGGVKDSGYGRFGGKAGIEAFTELRWITLQTTPRHYPF